MACMRGKCGMRRFDGHGTTTERPPNTEQAKQLEMNYNRLLQERLGGGYRDSQNSMLLQNNQSINQSVILINQPVIKKSETNSSHQTNLETNSETKYYNLSN